MNLKHFWPRLFVVGIYLALGLGLAFPKAAAPEIKPEIFALIKRVAPLAEVHPAVISAIEVHETGYYTSRLWKRSNNPGGMRIRYGKKAGLYASFPSPEEGIRAHALCLAHPRYNAARKTRDPFAQVDAIARAGYADSRTWAPKVKAHLKRILVEV